MVLFVLMLCFRQPKKPRNLDENVNSIDGYPELFEGMEQDLKADHNRAGSKACSIS